MFQKPSPDWRSVQLIPVANPTVAVCFGWMSPLKNGTYEIVFASQPIDSSNDFKLGERLLVRMDSYFMSAEIRSRTDDRLQVAECRMKRCERRAYPRMRGELVLRYRVLQKNESLETNFSDEGWHCAASKMNFSVTGLRFLGLGKLEPQMRLLCELGRKSFDWRCTARVLRVEPYPFSGADVALNFIAVAFENLPLEAADELTKYTLELQHSEFEEILKACED